MSGAALEGRSAWLITSGNAVGPPLHEGLVELGARVALIEAADSRTEFAAMLDSARKDCGAPDLVALAITPAPTLRPRRVEQHDAASWHAACHVAMKQFLLALQACHAHLGRGGAVVGLGPNLGLVGAGGLTALCAAIEGQRTLLKSTARQWGARGITLNWIALAPAVFAPELAAVVLVQSPEPGPPPLPLECPGDLRRDAAGLAAFLLSAPGRAITGATLALDGGEWMLP
jgi:3-oxoacyl-[acyl-carrier protein] reductase